MQEAYGVTSEKFDGLAEVCVLCAIFRLVPTMLVTSLLPVEINAMRDRLEVRMSADADVQDFLYREMAAEKETNKLMANNQNHGGGDKSIVAPEPS